MAWKIYKKSKTWHQIIACMKCVYLYIQINLINLVMSIWLLIVCVFPCRYYLSNSSKTFISQNRLKQRFCLFIKIWNVPFLQQSIKRRKSRMASEYIYISPIISTFLSCADFSCTMSDFQEKCSTTSFTESGIFFLHIISTEDINYIYKNIIV